MASNPDWYPANQDALVPWWANLYDQLKNHGMATKYGISTGDRDRCQDIALWLAYWVPRRHAEDTYNQAGTKYFKAIMGSLLIISQLSTTISTYSTHLFTSHSLMLMKPLP